MFLYPSSSTAVLPHRMPAMSRPPVTVTVFSLPIKGPQCTYYSNASPNTSFDKNIKLGTLCSYKAIFKTRPKQY